MIKNLEHIGIAVRDLNNSKKLFNKLLNKEPYKIESVESEFVNTLFYQVGETKIELLEASNTDSAIHKFIEKKGEGLHHLAFEVEDIVFEMQRLKNEGFILLHTEPKKGADNKLICFLHPKNTNGVLIELCQEII